MSDKQKCCAKVYSGRSYFGYSCGKNAKVERDGNHYCGIHDPVRVKEKLAASDEKFRKRMDEEAAAMRKARAEAAEQKRRADCYPDLLEALQAIVNSVPFGSSHQAAFERAQDAIKKATE